MSSRLVSSVCSIPPGSPPPARPCSDLLANILMAPLMTCSPIANQIADDGQKIGVVGGEVDGNAENSVDHN